MATLKGAKVVGAPFDNAVEVVRVIYDFSVDGGQAEDNTVITADGAILVRCIGAVIQTPATSATSAATIDLGVGASGTEFFSGEAVTAFNGVAFIKSEVNNFVHVADAGVINLGVAVEALTAGKIEFIFEVAQA